MKQGQATTSTSGSTKREPISHAVNIGSVSQIGLKSGPERANSHPLYQGRGLEAPMAGTTIHKKGSQGEHK